MISWWYWDCDAKLVPSLRCSVFSTCSCQRGGDIWLERARYVCHRGWKECPLPPHCGEPEGLGAHAGGGWGWTLICGGKATGSSLRNRGGNVADMLCWGVIMATVACVVLIFGYSCTWYQILCPGDQTFVCFVLYISLLLLSISVPSFSALAAPPSGLPQNITVMMYSLQSKVVF